MSYIIIFLIGSGPTYTQALKFNDKRNSMYLPIFYAPTIPWSSY